MRLAPALFALLGLAALLAPSLGPAAEAEAEARDSAYAFAFPGIDGAPLPLKRYRGRPLLVVNTASRCGFTGQYEGLQSLWRRYRDRGLVVIGAPSNDFRQELADSQAVKAFCETTFGVDFPMTDIVSVRGDEAHPFFAWAAARSEEPGWNFNKYLIDSNGELVRHYSARVAPDEIAADIESLLPATN